ncbi:MAG: hypothetical protein LQ345_002608 [Seirophora villosa]|nr:MAG: hypothetical protein LQ345_002608 [Seirophora villosa]
MNPLQTSDANPLPASEGQGGASQRTPRTFPPESDDTSGAMPIEAYLYRIEPFRSSSENPPLPFPYNLTELAPESLADLTKRIPDFPDGIRAIVQTHGLQSLGISACLLSKAGYPGGEPRPIIRIPIRSRRAHDVQHWHSARQEVEEYLADRQIQNMSVEIVDPDKAMVRSLFPLPPSDFLIQTFEAVSPIIRATLQDVLGAKWTSYCLFKVGPTAGRAAFCVFVTVQPYTVANWQRIRQCIISIMNTEIRKSRPHLVGYVQAAFSPGGMSLGAGRGPPQTEATPPARYHDPQERFTLGRSFIDNLDGHPKIGTSIGVVGSTGGGTLGGFFGLKVGNTIHRGFLTSHHVIAPDPGTGPASNSAMAVGHPTKTQVQYFAQADVEATQENIRISINANARTLHELEENLAQRTATGMDIPPNLLARRDTLRQHIPRIQESQQAASSFPRIIGHTIASSGRRAWVDQNIPELIDWAFVSVDDENLELREANKLPDKSEFGQDAPNTYTPGLLYKIENPGPAFSQFGSLAKGDWYFKKGRTTDITCGLCHGTEVVVNSTNMRSILQPNGESATPRDGNVCKVTIILNAKLNQPSARQKPFSAPGDSGSLVFNSFGEVCGLLFGSYSHGVSELEFWQGSAVEAGCVMSIEDVQRCIGIGITPRNPDSTPRGPPGQLIIP